MNALEFNPLGEWKLVFIETDEEFEVLSIRQPTLGDGNYIMVRGKYGTMEIAPNSNKLFKWVRVN